MTKRKRKSIYNEFLSPFNRCPFLTHFQGELVFLFIDLSINLFLEAFFREMEKKYFHYLCKNKNLFLVIKNFGIDKIN